MRLAPTLAAAAIVILIFLTPSSTRHGNAETKDADYYSSCQMLRILSIRAHVGTRTESQLVFSDDVPHGIVADGLRIDLDIEKRRKKEVVITPLEADDFRDGVRDTAVLVTEL